MWTASRAPTRPQRPGSVHSVASSQSPSRPTSMISPQLSRQPTRSIGYESDQSSDTAAEDEQHTGAMPVMWQGRHQETGSAVSRLSQKLNANGMPMVTPLRTRQPRETSPEDDARSRSSTLNGDDEQAFEFPQKTPRPLKTDLKMEKLTEEPSKPAPSTHQPPSHVPGPLESQLAALMSQIQHIERANPTASITPEAYAEMASRLATLEAEKKAWQKRHEAIWALRDEDVENNIKIRGMLAKARRDLDAMTKLRDDDLINVQLVRIKLADATRQLDRYQQAQQQQQQQGSGRASPSRGARPPSVFLERRDTTDLFAAAKAAALEQRALELEKRNSDLLSQIEILKGGASIDDLNRMTAHKAWKEHVADLENKLKVKDAQIAQLRSSSSPSSSVPTIAAPSAPSRAAPAPAPASASASTSLPDGAVAWHRVEAIHEEHAGYRERMGGKLQALRSEKEGLQKELHRKEDECHALEVKVQHLQRRVGVLA